MVPWHSLQTSSASSLALRSKPLLVSILLQIVFIPGVASIAPECRDVQADHVSALQTKSVAPCPKPRPKPSICDLAYRHIKSRCSDVELNASDSESRCLRVGCCFHCDDNDCVCFKPHCQGRAFPETATTTPAVPLYGVVFGTALTRGQWQTDYGFVVSVTITMDSIGVGIGKTCTGLAWKDRVLLAAHCYCANDGSSWNTCNAANRTIPYLLPINFTVGTAWNEKIEVTDLAVDPRYMAPGEGQGHIWERPDFLLLTLARPVHIPDVDLTLNADYPKPGTSLMLAGFGQIATTGEELQCNVYNFLFGIPIRTDFFEVQNGTPMLVNISKGPQGQGICHGDSGAPWFAFKFVGGKMHVQVTGIESGSINPTGVCGDPTQVAVFAPTSLARSFLEQVAPGHFIFTPPLTA